MYNLQQAFGVVVPLVVDKTKHVDYERTLKLARMYKAFSTGEDLEYMLVKFDRRESKEDFEQACRIAQHITKPTVSSITNPARKVASVRPIVDRVDYGKEDQKSTQLRNALSEWYGGKSVPEYMSTLIDPSDTDPNAFVLLTFDSFDYRRTKPTVYPVKVGCEHVYDFRYVNGELSSLFLGFQITYVTKPGYTDGLGRKVKAETAQGMRYVLYTAEHHIVLDQVDKAFAPKGLNGMVLDVDGTPVEPSGNKGIVFAFSKDDPARYFLRADDDRIFEVRVYEQKSGRVPAFRLGCKGDRLTDGRTCVNRWDEAVPYLKKSLKQVRELDLTTALHVFPQKNEYVGACTAKGCNGGFLPGGDACAPCKGSGFITISTAQDHKMFRLPKDAADPIWDLQKLTHYTQLPVDLIAQMREIVRETQRDCFRAVYGSDLYGEGNVGKTYEEVVAQNQAQYDALKPLADWWSETSMTITHVYASYNDVADNLIVVHKMPRSFGFETSATAFSGIKAAREAGASKALVANLDSAATDILFRDDSDALRKVKVQAGFDPFPGMTPDTITALISGGKVTDRSALMWTESATIFRKAEAEYPGDVSFYSLAAKKQQEVIDRIIDDMLEEVPVDPTLEPMLGVDEAAMSEAEAVDPNAPKVMDTALNGAQVSSLVEIIESVATGVLTKETASAMIQAAFPGIDDALVQQMLNGVKPVTPEQMRQSDATKDTRTNTAPPPAAPPTEQAA